MIQSTNLLQCVIDGDYVMCCYRRTYDVPASGVNNKTTDMRFFTLILATLVIMAPIAVSGDFLCGFMSFLGKDWPCRMSCKIQGYVSVV